MVLGEQLVALHDDRAEIMQVLQSYHSAMVDARTGDLDNLVDDDFALVHITGYVQPKSEWFGVIRAGQFDYHSIAVDAESVSISVSDKTAIAAGRGVFDATINGLRRPWRLQFTMRFAKHNDAWRIAGAQYTAV